MTEEHPTRPKTEAVFCDECNAAVRLQRRENRTLVLRCACGETRGIKLATALPGGWSE